MPLHRNQHRAVYHECQRCGTRALLSEMKWQNGLLLCLQNNCVDKAIIGSRDIAVANSIGLDRHELEPDVKITQPTDPVIDMHDVLF